MALIFTEGFDAYYDVVDVLGGGWTRGSTSITAVMGEGRKGYGQSMLTTHVSSTEQLTRSLGSNIGTSYVGFASNSAAKLYLCFYKGSTRTIFVTAEYGLPLKIYNQSNSLLAESVAGVIPSDWYHIEVGANITALGSGWVTVKINGVTVCTYSGATTITAGYYSNALGFTGYVDDLWFCDSTTGAGAHPNNTFLGDLRVETVYPSAIDTAQFSTTGEVSTLGFNETVGVNYDHEYYEQINVCAPVDNYLIASGATSARSVYGSDPRYGSSPVMSVNGFMKSITIYSTANYGSAYTRGVVCEWDVATQLPIGALTYSNQVYPIVAGKNTFTFPASTVPVTKGTTYCFGFITDTVLVLRGSYDSSVLGYRLPAAYTARPTTWSGSLRVCSPFVEYEIEVDNAGAVQETMMDGDRGYNYSDTTDEFDLFTTTAGIDAADQVYGVSVKGQYRVDAGARGAYNLLKSNTTTAVGNLKALTSSYALNQDVFAVNPATSAAWTPAEVNAMKIGYKTGA